MGKKGIGAEAIYIVQASFWDNIVFTLKVVGPLVKVLKLVDGESKPTIGYIDEAIVKDKEVKRQKIYLSLQGR